MFLQSQVTGTVNFQEVFALLFCLQVGVLLGLLTAVAFVVVMYVRSGAAKEKRP